MTAFRLILYWTRVGIDLSLEVCYIRLCFLRSLGRSVESRR